MNTTYTSPYFSFLSFILIPLRSIHFFEIYFYVPTMTLIAILIYRKLSLPENIWQKSFCFIICWLATNSFAVIFKAMIVEELDYPSRMWFEPYVPAIHFMVTLCCLFYLVITLKSNKPLMKAFSIFGLQIGLLSGYGIAVYRMVFDDFLNAVGGFILLLFFLKMNFDILSLSTANFKLSKDQH